MSNSITKQQITKALAKAMSEVGQPTSRPDKFKGIYTKKLTSGPERTWQNRGNNVETVQINEHIILLRIGINWTVNEDIENPPNEISRSIENLQKAIRSLVEAGWMLEYDFDLCDAEIPNGGKFNCSVRGIIRREKI